MQIARCFSVSFICRCAWCRRPRCSRREAPITPSRRRFPPCCPRLRPLAPLRDGRRGGGWRLRVSERRTAVHTYYRELSTYFARLLLHRSVVGIAAHTPLSTRALCPVTAPPSSTQARLPCACTLLCCVRWHIAMLCAGTLLCCALARSYYAAHLRTAVLCAGTWLRACARSF